MVRPHRNPFLQVSVGMGSSTGRQRSWDEARTSISMVDCDYERLDQRIVVFGQHCVERIINALGIATFAFWSASGNQKWFNNAHRLASEHRIQRLFDRPRLTSPFRTSCADKERFCEAEPGLRCNGRCWFFHRFNVRTVASLVIDRDHEGLDHAARAVACHGRNGFIDCMRARLLAVSLTEERNQERFNHLYRTLGADRRYRFLYGSRRSTRGLREQERVRTIRCAVRSQ